MLARHREELHGMVAGLDYPELRELVNRQRSELDELTDILESETGK